MAKWCLYCKAKTLKKITDTGQFIFDLGRMVYSTRYDCIGIYASCYGSYTYCKICMKMMSAGKLLSGASVWIHHVMTYHAKIPTQSPSESYKNLRISTFINCMSLNYDIAPKLFSVFPQLLVLSVNEKLSYHTNSSEEALNAIYSDIRNRNYSCKLCSVEYDVFPTLKLVHRHFKVCYVAVEVRNKN